MKTTQPIKIKRHANGLIAVDQGSVAGRQISFNPDDSMFYVHKHRSDEVIGTFPRLAAAVRFALMLGTPDAHTRYARYRSGEEISRERFLDRE